MILNELFSGGSRETGAYVFDGESNPIFYPTFPQIWKWNGKWAPLDPPLYIIMDELCLDYPSDRHHAKDSKSICDLWLAADDVTCCFIPSNTSCIAVLKAAILRLCEDSICSSMLFCDSMHLFCNRDI